ncbi:hypothetical protein DXG01_015514 [Tephrocybe rancida]|nr:hypothetical protein DXG01_015514 [Tephrocybe rancida]
MPEGRFIISNLGHSDKVLDLSQGDNTTIQGLVGSGGGNQKWDLKQSSSNYQIHLITNVSTGRYVGIKDGKPVGVESAEAAVNWVLQFAGNATWYIYVADPGPVVELKEDGMTVDIASWNSAAPQKWILNPVSA